MNHFVNALLCGPKAVAEYIGNEICVAAADAMCKHYDKKAEKDKATKKRLEDVDALIKKLNMEEVPYTEDFMIFKRSLKNNIPAIRAKHNPDNYKPTNYKTHFIDNDGSVQELNHGTTGLINFVERAMKNADKIYNAKSNMQITAIKMDEDFIKGMEHYDYKLMNDGSVLFVRKEE